MVLSHVSFVFFHQLYGLFENLMWIPFLWEFLSTGVHVYCVLNPFLAYSFFFFGGLSIPVTQAILAHLFSYNIQWSATIKEVERSNFFKEIPKIARRYGNNLCWHRQAILIINSLADSGSPCYFPSLLWLAWSLSRHHLFHSSGGLQARRGLLFSRCRKYPSSMFVFPVAELSRVFSLAVGCHILFPVSCSQRCLIGVYTHNCSSSQIVLNPWLMVFSY